MKAYLKAAAAYVVARFAEASTQAAAVAAAGALGGWLSHAMTGREAAFAVAGVLLPALAPDGWGPVVVRIVAALASRGGKVAPALVAGMLAASLSACALVDSVKAGKPLDRAQVAADLDTVVYLLKATGCALSGAGAAATPIVAISADAEGQQVLEAIDAAGAVVCKLSVPPSALPVPAPAGAAPALAAAS